MSESTAPAERWANPSERALEVASDHLKRLGHLVLARRFRDGDLIAGRWPLVIACEVSARGSVSWSTTKNQANRTAWASRPA